MSLTLNVKPRRFRVTLWEATDKFVPTSQICEVVAAVVNFSVGQIPMAAVNLPCGEEVVSGKLAKTPVEISQLVAKRQPLCVQVDWTELPMHATTSDLNATDPQCKWPKSSIIFKGYASAYSFYKTGSSTGITMNIQHWLCDLSAVSAYCPRSHTTNPTAFAIDINTFGLQPSLRGSTRHWSILSSTLSELMNNASGSVWGILDKVFRTLCTTSLELNDSNIGAISEEYVKRMEAALDRFVSHIEWHPKIRAAVETLSNDIITAIGSSTASSWLNTTIWDEVDRTMSGMFYYALAPTVDEVHVIPRPGAIADTCIELTENDILTFSMDVPTMPILDACILAYQNGTEHVYSEPSFVIGPMFPERRTTEKALYETKGGPIVVTSMPQWMQSRVIMFAMVNQDHVLPLHAPLAPTPGMPAAKSMEDEMDAAIETIGRDLVKFDYLSRVFAGRMAKFSTPFRADIPPGACVHVNISPVIGRYGDPVEVYGTVESVVVNIEGSSASTTFVLTNIRSKDEYESDIFNGGPVFYKEIWSGTDSTLYSES